MQARLRIFGLLLLSACGGRVYDPSQGVLLAPDDTLKGVFELQAGIAAAQSLWGVGSSDQHVIPVRVGSPGAGEGAFLGYWDGEAIYLEAELWRPEIVSDLGPDGVQSLVMYVTAHELGHAMGLEHEEDQNALMFANLRETAPDATDLAQLCRLWPLFCR